MGDCALLCSSPAEYGTARKERLPLLLRRELLGKQPAIEVFNPRGQDLTEIPVVAQFGGLLLECLDPGGNVEANTSGLNNDIISTFTNWRAEAVDLVSSAQAPAGLLQFAQAWALRNPQRAGLRWSRWSPNVPVLELIYGLVHYFPFLYDDPEGQIYLEVFTRQVSACQQTGRTHLNRARP